MMDLISRQAAIDKINERQRKLIYFFGFENDMVKIMDIARSIIIAMPSAQPEHECRTCRYNHLEWSEEPCDSCTSGGESNHWKPKEPEGDPCEGCKHIGKDIYEYPCDSCVHGGASCRWED